MSDYIIHNGTLMSEELYHHGVKGMKWGVRKAKDDYKTAKKARKQAYKEYSKTARRAIGVQGLKKYTKAGENYNKAIGNEVTAKANYKAAKSKNAEKAEFKTYRKEMQKTGLAGSAKDTRSGGRSTAIYNEIKMKKGEAYADKVAKKVQNRAIAEIATSVAVTVGAAVVANHIRLRNNLF